MQPEAVSTTDHLHTLGFKQLVVVAQVVCWPIIWLLSVLMNRQHQISLQASDLKPDSQYVIVASHGSRFDAFLISRHLPIGAFRRLIPLRFFLYNGLFDSWLQPILIALGCFPAYKHGRYLFGLEAANSYLRAGQAVVIFPEGGLYRGQRLKPRTGVTILAGLPNVRLIPVRISWDRSRFWPRYDIAIGRPFSGARLTAEDIMDRVYQL